MTPRPLSPLTRRFHLEGDTIARKFCLAVEQRGPAVAMRQKHKGVWREMSWSDLGDRARHIALGLMALSLAPGEVASILANTRWEWSACDYGILLAGGVSCGLDPTAAAAQVAHLCADSGTRFIFVEDDEQLDKVLELRAALPLLAKIIVIDPKGLTALVDAQVITMATLMAAGAEHERRHPTALQQRLDCRGPQDLAMRVYTAGATGQPQAAMLSNRRLCSMIEHHDPALGEDEADDKIAFQPLYEMLERVAGQLRSLQTGSRLNHVERPETVQGNLREIAPTVFTAVPRVWEKLHAASMLAIGDATGLEQAAYAWALRLASEAAAGRTRGLWQQWQLALANALVLRKVRRFLGVHRLRWAVTAGAPIAPDLIRWYRAIGIELRAVDVTPESAGGGVCTPTETPTLHLVTP